ncbi:MAG: hypothetical protein P4L43_05380 [Syntrophobacteraceae bacterium]|nr:hypothetical protein [Syntrophobacteraceae bacterium]
MSEIEYVRRCSQYFAILLRNDPGIEEWLLGEGNLKRRYPLTGLYCALEAEAAKATSYTDLLRSFRRFKQKHFLRIGARDFCRYADLSETTGQISDIASVALQVGLVSLLAHPDWWSGEEDAKELGFWDGHVPLVILGLGKLGGHELNYVSDIDLIFLQSDTPEPALLLPAAILPAGNPAPAARRLMSQLIHRLSRLMSDPFEGDRVFQVDFRLRPGGKEGVLAPSMSAAIEHYLLHGRAWERQMLLKCRPVAGDRSEGNGFIREVRPFVFRRFLDFQAFAELKEMRNRVLEEAGRFPPGPRYDVKLGIGGIREIEFLAQSLQLVYGGRMVELDEPNTLRCLEKLSTLGLLAQDTAEALKACYIFLRNVEHRVQLDQNRHTQRLPASVDARKRLALAMGFEEDERAFLKALETNCHIVHTAFCDLFEEKSEGTYVSAGVSKSFALDALEDSPVFAGGDSASRQSGSGATPVSRTMERFSHIGDRELVEKIFVRLDTYFGRVGRRTGLMKLFDSNGPWISPFCAALGASGLVAGLLSHNPTLVEGCTEPFEAAPKWEESAALLVDRAGDYGEKLEWIRKLKNERTIQLALADLEGRIDFATLEEELTSLADFVIRNTLAAVRGRLGLPEGLHLSVLGMGKLGSREMSYLSDLDLVFVYAPEADKQGHTIPVDIVRLIQRLMNMLQTPLSEGPGYEMDVRLRPTGTHGPLVVTRDSWREYYGKADIWEIQALLRVRHIAGEDALGRWIEDRAAELCFKGRPSQAVWPRICHLRGRMEKERAAEKGGEIDLKLGMGGLADIEFIVQGELLAGGFAKTSSSPAGRSVRQGVEELSKSYTTAGLDKLAALFRVLRALDHRVRLHTNSSSAKLDEGRFKSMLLLGLWPPRADGDRIESWQDVLGLRRKIRAIFKQFCP